MPANKPLTEPQYQALIKYRDGRAHNETALRIRENVYDNLRRKGLICRVSFLLSRITEDGEAALKAYEGRRRRGKEEG